MALGRLDSIVIWLVTIIVVPSVVLVVATGEPILARSTKAANDAIERADPLDRNPPLPW